MALHLNKLKFPSPNDGEIVPVILEKMRMYKQQTTDNRQILLRKAHVFLSGELKKLI